jgi:predicted lipid carrier protein YhbT
MSRDLGLGLVGERVLDGHELLVGRWPNSDAPHIPIMSPISRDHVPLGGLPRTIRARRSKGDRAMAKYLTQEWLDEGTKLAQGQPERPGASARMQYVVTGGPDGDVKYYWVLENGKLLENQVGEISDADFTLTLTYDDSVKVQKGELDANAAFMQGRMKVTGNMGKLMQLMPLTNSPEYKDLQEQIRGVTEY